MPSSDRFHELFHQGSGTVHVEVERLVDKLTPISRVYTSIVLSSPVPHRMILPIEESTEDI